MVDKLAGATGRTTASAHGPLLGGSVQPLGVHLQSTIGGNLFHNVQIILFVRVNKGNGQPKPIGQRQLFLAVSFLFTSSSRSEKFSLIRWRRLEVA